MTTTYIPLATITLSSSDSEIEFSSIPATYRDLIVVFNGSFSGVANSFWEVNGNNTGYSYVQMFGTGSGSGTSNTGSLALAGANYTENGTNIIQFFDYATTDKHKTALTRSSSPSGAVAAAASRWANTAAITSVRIFLSGQNFQVGSTFSLYGVN